MKGIFINDREFPYSAFILNGFKTYETRNRQTLRPLVGQRVAVIRTGGRFPVVVGEIDLGGAQIVDAEDFPRWISRTYVFPDSSRYPKPGQKKVCYRVSRPEWYPAGYPLPKDAVRHGRTWCEFSAE